MLTAPTNERTTAQDRYLFGLRHVNSVAFFVIGVCVLSPLLLLFTPLDPLVMAAPIIGASLIGMTMPLNILRWFGPTFFGGTSAAAVITLLAILLALLMVGSAIVLTVNPAGAPYLALPGLMLAFGMVSMVDVVLRGFLHSWMHHVGFGQVFRLCVPAVLVGLLALPSAIATGPLLLVGLVVASVAGGLLRHYTPGMGWMLVTPMTLLIAMFAATW